jgi:sugar transferase (PEP-CTERM/EpsH1 system associated)
MKILFVCHRFPYPPNRGGKIRPFNMIRHLSQKHTVVVGSLAHTEEELSHGAGLSAHCHEVLATIVPNSARWARAGKALFSRFPSSAAYFSSPELRRKIDDAVRRYGFDAVIVHCAFAAQYAVDIPAKFRLLDFGDLDSGKWFDYQSFRSFPRCLGYALEARKLRSYETSLAGAFDYCTVTTQGEMEELGKLNVDVPSAVIPNGVDSSYFKPAAGTRNGHSIVFVGRMDYFPNIDGAEYFAKNIFPIIRQRIPDARLQFVGSDPSRAVLKLANIPGVVVTGHVPDVRPYLKDATVTIAPLRLARGTQNKILESMAMGVPVVATSVAAKGVAAVPGAQLLVADEPEQFADAVVSILENSRLGQSISYAARRQVEEAHSWSRSMRILDSILDGVLEHGHQPGDIPAQRSAVNPLLLG